MEIGGKEIDGGKGEVGEGDSWKGNCGRRR